jgi:tyrosyl-tRNA synthetase
MDLETKLGLIKQEPTEEIITEADLRELLETNDHPQHYIGFEISGMLHIGSLVIPGLKIEDLLAAGCKCIVFLADWHAWINNKLEGDMEKIQDASKYYREAFQLISPKIQLILGSDLYHDNDDYWKNLVQVAKKCTLNRVTRCLTIMGRKEDEKLDFAQFLYPPLQSADIREMKVDIAHAGMDQRKVHMLVRDVFPKLNWKTPVALHNHLLPGLMKPERQGFDENAGLDLSISSKMSKSKPWTCIFIHDSKEQIEEKLRKAWCPEKQKEDNAPLEYVRYIIFRKFKSFDVERPQRFGGNTSFGSYEEVEKAFVAGELHAQDLKMAVASHLDKIVSPFREHFEKPANAKLLEVYKEVKVTR